MNAIESARTFFSTYYRRVTAVVLVVFGFVGVLLYTASPKTHGFTNDTSFGTGVAQAEVSGDSGCGDSGGDSGGGSDSGSGCDSGSCGSK